MALNISVTAHKEMKIFYDKERKIVFIDEIPNQIFNKTVYYPSFNLIESKGYKKIIEVKVPHKHMIQSGEIEINNISFPLWCIPLVEKIEKVEFEGNFWIKITNKARMYEYMIVSVEGLKSTKYLEIIDELPSYLKDINIWKK